MTYEDLEEKISRSCGRKMKIIDLGASSDLSQYSRLGNSCVVQAIAFAAFPFLKGRAKTLNAVLANPRTYLNLYSDVGIPLGSI
jgi:hypothetical protein